MIVLPWKGTLIRKTESVKHFNASRSINDILYSPTGEISWENFDLGPSALAASISVAAMIGTVDGRNDRNDDDGLRAVDFTASPA
jgi:hypothetical protein